ncbi:hypothetical protein Pan216_44130 [Planctomycetes bacterium Pan216]|uniref:Uncharacterized protein n=1 Tax=Kolteria novifilia TaxID=2527975 RepID=A0A518B9E7_9BACT|nr:hypothetical protein Pan216_44130 [Planctomycetes bacterium Pan216]
MTDPVPGRAPAQLTIRKRALFVTLVLLGLYGIGELAAWTAFLVVDARPFSFARLHRRQDLLRFEVTDVDNAGDPVMTRANCRTVALHPYLGYVTDPHLAAQDGRFPFAVNRFGFSDAGDPFHERGDDRVIIGVVGGSVAMGFSIGGLPAMERELRKSPHFAEKQFVYVRAAMGGYKQPQQLMTLNYLLALGAKIDLLINIDGFNEIALHRVENQSRDVAMIYPRSWALMVEKIPDPISRTLICEIAHRREERKSWARLFSKASFRHSIMLNLLWRARDGFLERSLVSAQQRLAAHRPEEALPYAAVGPGNPPKSEMAQFEDQADLWKRCSTQLHHLCQANNATYFHFLQPNQYVDGSKEMTTQERRRALTDKAYADAVTKGYPLLATRGRELAAEGIAFADLTTIFEDRGDTIYIDSCCHFNQTGTEILGTAIGKFILDHLGESQPDRSPSSSPPPTLAN